MIEAKNAKLSPIGRVLCEDVPSDRLRQGRPAEIEIYEPYREGLARFSEHNFCWVLCWLERADRSPLRVHPFFQDREKDEPYGVFAVRAPCRPNPISLTLTEVIAVSESGITVEGLDVYNGTEVLDIKPYHHPDSVFAPRAPYMRQKDAVSRERQIMTRALRHHGERCAPLAAAVRMACAAEGRFGNLISNELKIAVEGPACLADAMQGITRARLANPPRFSYSPGDRWRCSFTRGEESLTLELKKESEGLSADDIAALSFEELFEKW